MADRGKRRRRPDPPPDDGATSGPDSASGGRGDRDGRREATEVATRLQAAAARERGAALDVTEADREAVREKLEGSGGLSRPIIGASPDELSDVELRDRLEDDARRHFVSEVTGQDPATVTDKDFDDLITTGNRRAVEDTLGIDLDALTPLGRMVVEGQIKSGGAATSHFSNLLDDIVGGTNTTGFLKGNQQGGLGRVSGTGGAGGLPGAGADAATGRDGSGGSGGESGDGDRGSGPPTLGGGGLGTGGDDGQDGDVETGGSSGGGTGTDAGGAGGAGSTSGGGSTGAPSDTGGGAGAGSDPDSGGTDGGGGAGSAGSGQASPGDGGAGVYSSAGGVPDDDAPPASDGDAPIVGTVAPSFYRNGEGNWYDMDGNQQSAAASAHLEQGYQSGSMQPTGEEPPANVPGAATSGESGESGETDDDDDDDPPPEDAPPSGDDAEGDDAEGDDAEGDDGEGDDADDAPPPEEGGEAAAGGGVGFTPDDDTPPSEFVGNNRPKVGSPSFGGGGDVDPVDDDGTTGGTPVGPARPRTPDVSQPAGPEDANPFPSEREVRPRTPGNIDPVDDDTAFGTGAAPRPAAPSVAATVAGAADVAVAGPGAAGAPNDEPELADQADIPLFGSRTDLGRGATELGGQDFDLDDGPDDDGDDNGP